MSLMLKVANGTSAAMPGVGDPGLFGSIWSGIKGVASVAKAIPGPIGWAGSAISAVGGRGGKQKFGDYMPPPPPTSRGRAVAPQYAPRSGFPQRPTSGIRGFVQRGMVGGATGYETAAPTAEIGSPAGYHVNKTAYFLKDGTFIPKESRWIKNRRRNPLNPRAASKAISRIESLKRATARFSRITIRKKCQ